MKISVIIPTNRQDKLLDFELPSFRTQTFPKDDFEIIIVDDACINRKNDVESFAIANKLNIKWMRGKKPYYRSNANIGNARNTGLIHATGELIIFIDDYSSISPAYLEGMWIIYKENSGYSPIGPVTSVEFCDRPFSLKTVSTDKRLDLIKSHGMDTAECPSNWFYTSNASAPMREILKLNGFWEMADLTREEDALFGLALSKNGWKFCFAGSLPVYHMIHSKELGNKRYNQVNYKDLGWDTVDIEGRMVDGGGPAGRCGLTTAPEEIQLVTKDIFNTKYPGSWGLIEYFNNHPKYRFNEETGFDLRKERKEIGMWV
ncbi:MAG: glycosyltransferase family 2 protein [Desulfocapsaceae bacterium]|nr:glycosyltransferase family 2 protein [Desulfocapsaceae bacterium]